MIDLFNTRSVTFDEPIEMLYACHGKVRRFCQQISQLPDYIKKNGCDAVVLQAVHQIKHYFNVAAPLHHEDEEQDFFPLLLQYAPEASENINKLLTQHKSLHLNWVAAAEELDKLEQDKSHILNQETLSRFTAGYDIHLAIEEPMFDLGKQKIPTEELTRIGKNMAARRHPEDK